MKKARIELVMVASKKDAIRVLNHISYLEKNIDIERILLITASSIENQYGASYPNVMFIDEDRLLEGLSFQTVKNLIQSRIGDASRAGLYFQQFLKMAYAEVCKDEYYIIWDADTIPLHVIEFFDEENHPMFNMKQEYHEVYFDTIEKLLGIKKCKGDSFISENMIIKSSYMRELIQKIEENNQTEGIKFWEKIINAIELNQVIRSGFSEFETYGTYVTDKYPNIYRDKVFHSYRHGNSIFGYLPSDKQLEWVAEAGYEAVAFEQWDFRMPLIPLLLKFKIFRNMISLEKVTILGDEWRKLLQIAIEIRIKLR